MKKQNSKRDNEPIDNDLKTKQKKEYVLIILHTECHTS